MDLTPEVSTALTGGNGRGFALGTGGSVTIPLISVRTLTSRVMVKSGHTLALGGLLESASTRAFSKVPFFGDIPAIGELFRSRSYNKTKRNLLIFVTPTVIDSIAGSGLEDQYANLKEGNENDRFAYKKSFLGNAKPRDQFRIESNPEASFASESAGGSSSPAPQRTPVEPAPEEFSTTPSYVVPPSEPPPADFNQDQLAPRLAPSLRE
jgi:Flp pilus assembly secretin CpaC